MTRVCSCCNEEKLKEDFPKQRTLCKPCHNKKTWHLKQKWKLLNPDKVLADRIRRSEIHKEIAKQHYQQNIELYKQKMRLYAQQNPIRFRVAGAKYRASKLRATPAWADLLLIKDVYLEAAYMQMQVDHIYPLAGKLVCGLHVWENLQLLPKTTNIKKSNKMPTEEYVSCLS